jgi:hypothetical protein
MFSTILILAMSSLGAFDYADHFDYPDGSEGAPAWNANNILWETSNGAMTFSGEKRSFLSLKSAPFGDDLSFEARVVVNSRGEEQWGVAGVAIRADDSNYWHLAIAEAPESQGKRHFVELTEMLNGVWLSQSAQATQLPLIESQGGDFNWRYGESYRLVITLSSDSIRGEVYDSEGALKTSIAYSFQNKAVRAGRPALTCSGFTVQFDDASANVRETVSEPEAPAATFPPYDGPGCTSPASTATGYFRVEQIDGRWWVIDPNGKSFYIVGTDHANYNVHWCQKLGYAPYAKFCAEKYGSEEKWAESTMSRLRDWNFTTLAANNSVSLRGKGLPHIQFLSFGSEFAGMDDICPRTTWTGFPDVFNPKWARYCEKEAQNRCGENKNDPWLIGYFIDNELEWFGKNHKPWGLFDETWKKPREHAAKAAWVRFLKEEAVDPATFRELWGVSINDFDDLLDNHEPAPPLTERAREIAEKWVRLCADEYFRIASEAIRKADPHHMVLGCRFAGDAPRVLDIAGKYCDIVSINTYPRIDVERGIPQSLADKFEIWSEQAARPIMITEWSFPALDTPLPSEHGAGMRVDTQRQRAKCFEHFQTFLFSLPYVVGSDYFMWVDEPALGISESFPEDSNYGLVNEHDEPYPDLTNTARAVNAKVYDIHREAKSAPIAAPRVTPEWIKAAPEHSAPLQETEASILLGAYSVKISPSTNSLRIYRGDSEIGTFFPLVHQGITAWTSPDSVKDISISRESKRVVIDAVFVRGHRDGVPASPQETDSGAFETGWRFVIPADGAWVACFCLWAKNADSKPWALTDMYYYALPRAGAPNESIELIIKGASNYYRGGAAWFDSSVNFGLGFWNIEDESFSCLFWKGPNGGLHPDLRMLVDKTLQPGDRIEFSAPPVFLFPFDKPTPAHFSEVVASIEASACN